MRPVFVSVARVISAARKAQCIGSLSIYIRDNAICEKVEIRLYTQVGNDGSDSTGERRVLLLACPFCPRLMHEILILVCLRRLSVLA